ncbi:MAG TPA: DNA repair protein RecN [Amoebophilaceae bacterium]|jgi:DNA repair protein RecN (Recombination protein N)|nr:DNA repair protein RecN [Amoebophilaceae bacterium]
MLQQLYIKHFLFIESLEIDFQEGLCVITGETGAGKSILLDAILFCFGSKYSNEVVQKGATSCSVALVFTMSVSVKQYLSELELISETDDTFVVQRLRTHAGRNKCFVNNQPVTPKVVEQLFHMCIEIQGQHTHTALTNTALHATFLDAYGQLGALQKEVSLLYKTYKANEREQARLGNEHEARAREQDYLVHICQELDQAAILPQEEELLTEKIERLRHKESEQKRILELATDIRSSSIQSIIERFQRTMHKAPHNPSFEPIAFHLSEAYDHIAHVQNSLKTLQNEFETMDTRLEQLEERLYELRALARKHNCSIHALPERLEHYRQQLQRLEAQFVAQETVAQEAIQAQSAYLAAATRLSTLREKSAESLATKTKDTLSGLQLPKATFSVVVERNPALMTETGIDKVRFLVSTNPGMPLAPIDKIASGGELSRFMLGLRTVLAHKLEPKVLVFDEIDVGTSGSVADAIGAHLQQLSQTTQVIAVTHQPQVAGKADQHILVEKQQYEQRTTIGIRVLTDHERPMELARMISGKEITAAGLQAAKELLTAL